MPGINAEIQVTKAEWYVPPQMWGRKDRKALELRVLVNGKTYACVKYEREKAISSILFDVRQETGMDLSSLLPGMVSRKERG